MPAKRQAVLRYQVLTTNPFHLGREIADQINDQIRRAGGESFERSVRPQTDSEVAIEYLVRTIV